MSLARVEAKRSIRDAVAADHRESVNRKAQQVGGQMHRFSNAAAMCVTVLPGGHAIPENVFRVSNWQDA